MPVTCGITSNREAERFSPSAYRMTFVTNHDENSWNGTGRERYGDGVRAMAVLCGTAFGMPLIYGGQESEMDKRLRFFEKDTVPWGSYRSMSFYRILNDLHHRNTPLYNGEFGARPSSWSRRAMSSTSSAATTTARCGSSST